MNTNIVIVPIDPREIVKSAGLDVDLPVTARAAIEGEELLAVWGLAWSPGRCWLWLHVERSEPKHAFTVIREAKRMLKRAAQLGETEVYTPRDASRETSANLLKLVGFEFFAVENGTEVFIWRV